MKTIPDNLLRAVIGPMEGVMGAPFASTVGRMRLAGLFITPFLRVSEHVPPSRAVRRFLAQYDCGLPVILQLMGSDPAKLAATAAVAASEGVSGINLNFGCPSRQVVRGGAGSAVLRNPDLLCDITGAVSAAAPDISVSVKIRTGFDSPDEMESLLPRIDELPLDFVAVHGRCFRESYAAVPDMEKRFLRILELLPRRRVLLNGDIADSGAARHLLSCGASGVMCARTFLRDPWLLRRVDQLDAPEPEQGRMEFFGNVLEEARRLGVPYRPGQAIELSGFIWGAANPFMAELLALQRAGDFLPKDLSF